MENISLLQTTDFMGFYYKSLRLMLRGPAAGWFPVDLADVTSPGSAVCARSVARRKVTVQLDLATLVGSFYRSERGAKRLYVLDWIM